MRLRDASKTGSHADARREQPCAFVSVFCLFGCCAPVCCPFTRGNTYAAARSPSECICFADAAGDCGDGFLSGARGDEQKADFYREEAASYFKICIRLQISVPFT